MNNKYKNFLWVSVPFILVLGSYIVLHIVWNFNSSYGFIGASFLTLLYILAGSILYLVFRNKSRPLARGIIWGVASVVIFLFTIGGCGVFR